MAISKDLETQILKVVAGLFNAAPGGSNLTELANLVDGGMSISQLSDALAANTLFTNGIMAGRVTVEDQVEVMMNHFGLVHDGVAGSAATQAEAYFTQKIDVEHVGFGKIVYDAVTFLSSTTDAAFTTTATLLANKALVAEAYSKTSSSSDLATLQTIVGSVQGDHAYTAADVAKILEDVGAVPGKSFTLTSDSDSGSAFAGTSANDTFSGTINGTDSTFNLTDTISGGAGTDTLSLTALAYADNDPVTVASVSGFEVLTLRAADATAADDIIVTATNFPGLTTFNNDRSTSNVQITAMAAGTSVNVLGNGSLTNADTTAAYGATVTTGTLNLKGGVTAGAVALNGAGLTTVAIGSSGAANVAGAISTNSAVVTAVTIAAEKALTTTGLTVANAGAVDASLTISGAATDTAATATAAATSAVVLGALDTDFTSVTASGLTAGGVSATLSATVAATFVGGAGNDTITTSTSGQTGSVDAGAGTGDTLVLTASAHIDSTAEGAIYKGFEVLHSNDAAAAVAIDMDLITGSTITAIKITDAANGTAITDMSAAQAAAITVTAGAGAMTLGVKNATNVGTLNTLGITVSDGDTTGSEAAWGTGDLTVSGVETINLTATDDVTWATMANIAGLTSLVATGGGDVSITTGAHAASANESINFSGLTAASTFNFAATTANAMAFTGGSGIDTVTDSAIGGNDISTGAGNDVITLTDKTSGTGATVVTGGAGADATTTAMIGNVARDFMKFVYAAGDSVSDSSLTNGISTTKTDTIIGLDGATSAAAAGANVTFDTEASATAVTSGGSTSVTFGTSTVTNAFDFYVVIHNATTATIYQDTDGDKIIESGEFAVSLTGIATSTLVAGDFAVSSGDLVLLTT
ncbi:MAG: hypothetical protein Q7T85_12970 [Nitrosomonas sp.]|nr:hypothetical protein [Nitrosomonas sp.]